MPRTPRVPLLSDADMNEEQIELVKHYRRNGELPNIFRVALRNTKLFKAYKPFGLYTMALSSVPPRLRELAIMRVAFLHKSDYEWGQHVRLAREAGVTNEELERVKIGPHAPEWDALTAATVSLVDQIKNDADLDDATYTILLDGIGEDGLTDLINTVGNYAMVASMLKIFGVPLEPGVPGIDSPLE